MVIRWTSRAEKQLKAAYEYIKAVSPQGAESVRDAILSKVSLLATYPEAHPLEKYKANNDGTYRYFEVKSYRMILRH